MGHIGGWAPPAPAALKQSAAVGAPFPPVWSAMRGLPNYSGMRPKRAALRPVFLSQIAPALRRPPACPGWGPLSASEEVLGRFAGGPLRAPAGAVSAPGAVCWPPVAAVAGQPPALTTPPHRRARVKINGGLAGGRRPCPRRVGAVCWALVRRGRACPWRAPPGPLSAAAPPQAGAESRRWRLSGDAKRPRLLCVWGCVSCARRCRGRSGPPCPPPVPPAPRGGRGEARRLTPAAAGTAARWPTLPRYQSTPPRQKLHKTSLFCSILYIPKSDRSPVFQCH